MRIKLTQLLHAPEATAATARTDAESPQSNVSAPMLKLRRVLIGTVGVGALAVGLISQAPIDQAIARTARGPGIASQHAHSGHLSGRSLRYRGAARVTVRMHILTLRQRPHQSGRPMAVAAGVGTSKSYCGTATLETFPRSSDSVYIGLVTTVGFIKGGYVTVSTNGLFSAPDFGVIWGTGSRFWATDDSLWNSAGLYPSEATAQGLVVTTAGTCGFYVTAPWDDSL
jgi:hypothetical protein